MAFSSIAGYLSVGAPCSSLKGLPKPEVAADRMTEVSGLVPILGVAFPYATPVPRWGIRRLTSGMMIRKKRRDERGRLVHSFAARGTASNGPISGLIDLVTSVDTGSRVYLGTRP